MNKNHVFLIILSPSSLYVYVDEKSVSESPYVTKMRGLIAGALFHQGKLSAVMTRRLGFDLVPPPLPQVSSQSIDTPTTSSTSSVLETASKIGQSS